MITKTLAVARQILYGKTRLSGLLSVYVLLYLVLVTGTMSHQVPSDIADMVILAKTPLSMFSARLNACLGSSPLCSSYRDLWKTEPLK